MSLNACILIKTTPLQTDGVLEKTRGMSEVRKAFVAYGRYDLVVFALAEDYSAIRKLTSAINSLEGVRSTETLVEA
jgi:DNA-binding Lrp family transcriptional regulator